MTLSIDAAHKELDRIIATYEALNLADANEAETRRKVIDEVLHKVLGWETADLSYEERISEDGATEFADYIARVVTTTVLFEAKRVGAAFVLPATNRKTLKLGGVLSEGLVGTALRQARDYCRKLGVPFAVVTNGGTWIVFAAVRTDGVAYEDTYAWVFSSLQQVKGDFVHFWELLSRQRVIEGNLQAELHGPSPEGRNTRRRLLTLLKEPGFRLGRNAVYEHIEPAVSRSFAEEAILSDSHALAECYVKNSERVKFDSRISMYLQDIKPALGHRTTRVRARKNQEALDTTVQRAADDKSGSNNDDGETKIAAPPRFIVLLGPVGAGKTTFLHYTRSVSARGSIEGRVLWFYIDFKRATGQDEPRQFIYRELLSLIESDSQYGLGEWKTSIQPAYAHRIDALKRGPLFLVAQANPDEFNREIAKEISREREQIVPYVNAILAHAAKARAGFLVVDNVDQIESDEIQSRIFAETQAIAHRIGLNAIMSLRDVTYLRHKNTPTFDAFEFESMYVDPPPIGPVLSRRFGYAKAVLEGRSARVTTESGIHLEIKDLSVFFDIVSTSLLAEEAGFMIEVLSGGDIRRGLSLVREFLASGHTSADHAMATYLSDGNYRFPLHEVFRGTLLGQRKYYTDEFSLIPNLFDSKVASRALQLLRLRILGFLVDAASDPAFDGVSVDDVVADLRSVGVSEVDTLNALMKLAEVRSLRPIDAVAVAQGGKVAPTRLAGYLVRELACQMSYAECCALDSVIFDDAAWEELSALTLEVEAARDSVERMRIRCARLNRYMEYLGVMEDSWIVEVRRRGLDEAWARPIVRESIVPGLSGDLQRALQSAEAVHGSGKTTRRRTRPTDH